MWLNERSGDRGCCLARESACSFRWLSEWACTLWRVIYSLNDLIMFRRVCQIGHELNLNNLLGWVKLSWRLLNLEITDWESVKISITKLRGAVEIAERIERSSALYDEGQD